MEALKGYQGLSHTNVDAFDYNIFNILFRKCTTEWEYQGNKTIANSNSIFANLQYYYMALVYLQPGLKKFKSMRPNDFNSMDSDDNAAFLSMMFERFGGRPINPSKVETGNAIPVIGTGDVLPALVDLSNTELSYFTIADKIYTCMIEVKYKNSDLKLASWLKEVEAVDSIYNILDYDKYDIYMKAYNEAFQKYGQDTANDTLLDYGCVLTPDIFESKKSFNEALNEFARTIRNHFGNSSFYKNTGNENYVAKSYVLAKKMCENSAFCDITDIYACDMDVVSHTYGYDSSNIILLADTQVVQLNDSYGEDCDTDQDDLNDNVEAHTPEEVDITKFLEVYCDYNKYTPEEKAEMLANNNKVIMYNYSSNPVLPDSDFDGRNDFDDGRKLDNEYDSINETNNYNSVKIKFAQDYRYFFMDSTQYYEELAEMGLILSNMASKKTKNNVLVDKKWTNKSSGDNNYTANNLKEYMWYLRNDNIVDHTNENVPYMIGQHDVIAFLGKVNNLERNVITLVVGENDNYKDILAANYDGSLDNGSGDDIHHQGYDYYAEHIYQSLIDYDNTQNADRWKKSYWIVGYGTGGSVANLVAKKFIDYKHVNTNIYCYTYQAPYTINKNNLTKKIPNIKYHSIFNIENTDDILLNLSVEENDWTKYGAIKKLSVGDNKDAREAWKKLINNSHEYKGGSKYLQSLKEAIFGSVYLATFIDRIKYKNSYISNLLYGVVGPNAYSYGANINNKGKVAQQQAEDAVSDISVVIAQYLETVAPHVIENPEEEKAKREKLKSKLLDSINLIGKWYADNIATYYKDGLQTETVAKAKNDKGNSKYRWHRAYVSTESIAIKGCDNASRDKPEKNYNIIVLGNSDDLDTIIAKDSVKVLRASDDAVKNYKDNYEELVFGTWHLYPCIYLEKGSDDYQMAGDDCVRFAFACYKNMETDFISKFKQYSSLNWNEVRSHSFAGCICDGIKKNKDVAYSMYKLGFDVYSSNIDNYYIFDIDGDGKKDYEIKQLGDSFTLEATDLVALCGHVHFCLEDDIVGNTKQNFSWGRVYREYPLKCSFYYNVNSHNIIGGGDEYPRLYRYVGGR